MKKIIILLLIFQFTFAQIPHLSGEVSISIKNGTIESNLEYSNVPKIKNYSLWLNSGLNLRYLRDAEDKFNYPNIKYFDDEKSAEAFQYYIPDGDVKIRLLPEKFKINYVGKFPVISDTLKANNRGDWKGNIAFNGKSIRTTEQSAWYPIIYDIDNDVVISKVTYDLTVNCSDCSSIYLNGAAPKSGNSVNFKSNQPISLLLFAGIFDFTKNKNTFFINTDLKPEQETVLSNWTDKIIKFYENNLRIPYGNPVTYLYTTPISKKNAWMFVTYPTVAIIGPEKYNVKSYFSDKTNELNDAANIEYFAHELGHYYFGTVIEPNSELRWIFLEGITEYLALQTIKEVLGENNYKRKIAEYLVEVKELNPKPLSIIKNNEISESYRYYFVPLLLTALEKEIGKQKVWNWLQTILKSDKTTKTDYAFFKSSIIKSGISENDFLKFETKYILTENAKENVIKVVK
ncbi:MAG: hypothetical protein O9267_09790 [Flavobacterium sp.]|uniref:hypothetical protein n=1 Tax=Flavobacterium sp. TaxID=239 RepID=UPI0022BDEF2B|nr:hypothetical protein [Flavobacterium sp.]MCZ8197885.1 hypothetical protein [Flavobacterium sp.]